MIKNILILRDSRTGNFLQARAAAALVSDCLKRRDIESRIGLQEIEFKNRFAKTALTAYSMFSGDCRAGRWWLRSCLKPGVFRLLM